MLFLLLFSCSVMSDCLWLIGLQKPGFPVLHYLLEYIQIHVHWVNYAIQPSHPLSLSFLLPSVFLSIRIFSNELALHIRRPNYWHFSLSINSSKEYSGLISSRSDWFELLDIQGNSKSLLQHHSSKRINSSGLSLLYGPTLTSVHDHWKNHSFDCTKLCSQTDVSAF